MVTPSELPPDASEAERLLAARAAIATMRAQRKARVSAVQTQADASTPVWVSVPTPVQFTPDAVLPRNTATTTSVRPHSNRSAVSPAPADNNKLTANTYWKSGLSGLGMAAVIAIGGFIAGRITAPTVSISHANSDQDRTEQTVQQLQKDNLRLARYIDELEVETTTLHKEVLAMELQAIAPNASDSAMFENVTASGSGNETDSLNNAPPPNKTVIGANALTTLGIDSEAMPMINSAFNRSLDALADIDASYEKGTTNYAERAQSRRQVREQLVRDIGLQAFLAGQHALGEPNHLLVTDIAQANVEVPVESGDVLLSIDGQRVVDLEQLRWVENDMLDSADDDGISGDNHVLEILRNGERLAITYDLPLEILPLDQESVDPSVLD